MNNLADLLGAPGSIEFRGITYSLRPPNQIEQSQFARWLEKRAREAAARSVDLEPEIQDRLLQAAIRDASSGYYEWGSDGYTSALGSPIGLAKMLSLILSAANPATPVDESLARELVEQKLAEIVALMLATTVDDDAKKKEILRSVGLPESYLDTNAA